MKSGDWQPIETAPKDGTAVLGWVRRLGYVARQDCVIIHWSGWGGGVWENDSGYKLSNEPEFWMPLPESPEGYCNAGCTVGGSGISTVAAKTMKLTVEAGVEEMNKATADAMVYGNGVLMWDLCTMKVRHIQWKDVQNLAAPEQQSAVDKSHAQPNPK